MTGSLPADTFGTVLRSLGHDLDGNELRNITQLFPPDGTKVSEQHVELRSVLRGLCRSEGFFFTKRCRWSTAQGRP